MKRAKKILIWLFLIALLLTLVTYLVGNHLLGRYSQQAMTVISNRGKQFGVAIEEPSFEQARISGIRTARWTDLRARLQFPENDAFDPNRTFDAHIGQVEIWLSGGGKADLEAQEITIVSSTADAAETDRPAAKDARSERILARRFHCQFEFDLLNPMPDLVSMLPALMGLMRAGPTPIPVEIEADLEFSLKGEVVNARIEVAEVEGGQTLVLSSDDLRPLSKMFDEALTDAEISLIASYPLRAAQLLRTKDDAESTAKVAHERDEQVPQDAYRHILWSYLLTKKYGAEFAERVTNAHEEGDTGNSPAEREMDYHNNAVGRSYAEQSVPRQQILTRLESDQAVIRESR
jgi:hypothetical protein